MSLTTKILLIVSATLALFIATFVIYKQIEISDQQKAIETQVVLQKELVNNITRSLNEYASKKDIEQFAKANNINLKAIQDDMDKLHAEIGAINTVTSISHEYHESDIPSSHSTPGTTTLPTVECGDKKIPCPDPYQYMQKKQDLILSEKFDNVNVPFGEVGFSAWKEKPWTLDILQREYKVTSVVGLDENKRQFFYNKFMIRVDNKDYEIKINNAVTKQQYPESKFSFNPRFYFNFNSGLNLLEAGFESSLSLNISLLSLGQYRSQPDFSILQLGLGWSLVDSNIQFIVSPGAYNVGKHIPLMNNVYIGPSFAFGVNGDKSVLGTLGVAL